MKNLEYVRKQKGLSQTQLANLLNISKNTVLNWENGDRQPPFEAIVRLAQHLGFSLDDFAFKDLEKEGVNIFKAGKGGEQVQQGGNFIIKAADFPTYCTTNEARFHEKALVPGIAGMARTFEVATDSMVPLLNFSDWVVCTPVDQYRDLEDGRVFVVVTLGSEVIIGYGQSYKEGVKVMPHNHLHPWQVVPYGQVYEVWQVRMRLTKYFMLPYVVGEVGGAAVNEPREQGRAV